MMQTATVVEMEPEETAVETKKISNPVEWDAKVLAFACHYCAFAAADLAGVMRLSYSPDHSYVLRAFERGIDGVFVAG
jgi:hypothetical protein